MFVLYSRNTVQKVAIGYKEHIDQFGPKLNAKIPVRLQHVNRIIGRMTNTFDLKSPLE